MASIEIVIHIGVVDCEADGSQCMVCGDNVYMEAKQITISAGNQGEISRLEDILCQSCGDAVKSDLDSDGEWGVNY